MATVNRYTQSVTPARFNPMSLQELSVLPAYKRAQHDKAQAELSQLDMSAAAIADSDPQVKAAVDSFSRDSQDAIGRLSSEGYNQSTADNLLRLKRRYAKEMTPINNYIAAKKQAIAQQQKDRSRLGASAIFKDVTGVTYDQYSSNPNAFAYTPINTTDITKATAEVFNNLPNIITSSSGFKGILNNQYFREVRQRGFGSIAQAVNFLNTEEGRFMKQQIIASMPALEELGDDQAINAAIARGVVEGIGKTEIETLSNKLMTTKSGGKQTLPVKAYRGWDIGSPVRGIANVGKQHLVDLAEARRDPDLTDEERAVANNQYRDFIAEIKNVPKFRGGLDALNGFMKNNNSKLKDLFSKHFNEAIADDFANSLGQYYDDNIALPYTRKTFVGELLNLNKMDDNEFISKLKDYGLDLDSAIAGSSNKEQIKRDIVNGLNSILKNRRSQYDKWYDNIGKKITKEIDEYIKKKSVLSERILAPTPEVKQDVNNILRITADPVNVDQFNKTLSLNEDGEEYDSIEDMQKIARSLRNTSGTNYYFKPSSQGTPSTIIMEGNINGESHTISMNVSPSQIRTLAPQLAIASKDPNIYYDLTDSTYNDIIEKRKGRTISVAELSGINTKELQDIKIRRSGKGVSKKYEVLVKDKSGKFVKQDIAEDPRSASRLVNNILNQLRYPNFNTTYNTAIVQRTSTAKQQQAQALGQITQIGGR